MRKFRVSAINCLREPLLRKFSDKFFHGFSKQNSKNNPAVALRVFKYNYNALSTTLLINGVLFALNGEFRILNFVGFEPNFIFIITLYRCIVCQPFDIESQHLRMYLKMYIFVCYTHLLTYFILQKYTILWNTIGENRKSTNVIIFDFREILVLNFIPIKCSGQ